MKKKWNIYDAKNGDILVTNEQIFIFKEIGNRDYVDNCIEYYCRVYNDEFYMADGGYMGTVENEMRKATKKEKEKLFALMHIAGYIWNLEDKIFKKLAHHPDIVRKRNNPSLLDKAVDFIIDTQKDDDKICEQMDVEWCKEHCIDNLRKECVIKYLTDNYKMNNYD